MQFFGHFIFVFSSCISVEGFVSGDQAAGVHRSSSTAVYRSCAVPTGCSGGLRPCVWRGAEGRRAPWWGSRTGAAGTVLLPQERAVQTAWRSGTTHSRARGFKHTNTDMWHKTRGDAPGRRDVGKMDETGRQDRQKAREGGRAEERQERSETRHETFSPGGKSEKQKALWEKQWKPMKKKETHRGGNERGHFPKKPHNMEKSKMTEWRRGWVKKWASEMKKDEDGEEIPPGKKKERRERKKRG